MTNQHPDAGLKVGSTREAADLTWTLYKNQFGLAWRAGPRAKNVVIGNKDDGKTYPYYLGEVGYATFEKVAAAAVAKAEVEYTKARKLVDDYEKWN